MRIKTKVGQSTGSKRVDLLTLAGLSTGTVSLVSLSLSLSVAQSFDRVDVSGDTVAQSFDRTDVLDTGYSLLACVKDLSFVDTSTFDRVDCGGD